MTCPSAPEVKIWERRNGDEHDLPDLRSWADKGMRLLFPQNHFRPGNCKQVQAETHQHCTGKCTRIGVQVWMLKLKQLVIEHFSARYEKTKQLSVQIWSGSVISPNSFGREYVHNHKPLYRMREECRTLITNVRFWSPSLGGTAEGFELMWRNTAKNTDPVSLADPRMVLSHEMNDLLCKNLHQGMDRNWLISVPEGSCLHGSALPCAEWMSFLNRQRATGQAVDHRRSKEEKTLCR